MGDPMHVTDPLGNCGKTVQLALRRLAGPQDSSRDVRQGKVET